MDDLGGREFSTSPDNVDVDESADVYAGEDDDGEADGSTVSVPVPELDDQTARCIVQQGELEILGHMPWSSNATFLALARLDGIEATVVYKPRAGERPLWDFPDHTLANREVAAGIVSDALGWNLVPPTELRDGPYGVGMVQLFIDHDPDDHFFTLADDHEDAFKAMAAFDVLVNNADRKGGHCLFDRQRHRIIGIDHGLTFHVEPKLRTVIWQFGGAPLPPHVADDLRSMQAAFEPTIGLPLRELISSTELEALRRRLDVLVENARFPVQEPGWHTTPWPLV